MSIHIGAKPGEIASFVLVPGDPYRARNIAEVCLENPVLHSDVRGMLGYTGTYKGKPVSTQGTGMGLPSHMIYIRELAVNYGAKTIIRIGTAGALRADIKCGSICIASGAVTDSNIGNIVSECSGKKLPPVIPDRYLYDRAFGTVLDMKLPTFFGKLFSSDIFYGDIVGINDYSLKMFADDKTVKAVEMETYGLYLLGKIFHFSALSICTISDNLVTDEHMTSTERENSFETATQIALSLL